MLLTICIMGWAMAAIALVACAYFCAKVETYELFLIDDDDNE